MAPYYEWQEPSRRSAGDSPVAEHEPLNFSMARDCEYHAQDADGAEEEEDDEGQERGGPEFAASGRRRPLAMAAGLLAVAMALTAWLSLAWDGQETQSASVGLSAMQQARVWPPAVSQLAALRGLPLIASAAAGAEGRLAEDAEVEEEEEEEEATLEALSEESRDAGAAGAGGPPAAPAAPPAVAPAPAAAGGRLGSGPKKLTFYMYRAEGDKLHPFENLNTADLPGVLWYLHNEIVVSTPRKYGVTSIVRYKVTMKNTQALYDATGRQFGPFVAFDSARCTVPNCNGIWQKYGYVVGCQAVDPTMNNYVPVSAMPCEPPRCKQGAWYSMPGSCPAEYFTNKTEQCILQHPGGACDAVNGARTCTYHAERAGLISLDELVGIPDYQRFVAAGSQEYSVAADRGRGTSFWDGRLDQSRCLERMTKVLELFQRKYPQFTDSLVEEPPPCGSS